MILSVHPPFSKRIAGFALIWSQGNRRMKTKFLRMNAETGKAQETEEDKTDVRANGGNCQEGKPKQRRKNSGRKLTKVY